MTVSYGVMHMVRKATAVFLRASGVALLLGSAFLVWQTGDTMHVHAQEPVNATKKWEYCTIMQYRSWKCEFASGREFIKADSWEDLARELKVPLKSTDEKETIRPKVLDFLGGRGWELVSHTVGFGRTGQECETFVFKRESH